MLFDENIYACEESILYIGLQHKKRHRVSTKGL